ncbi:magnesium chelatase, partial [Arthrospira platensis SPKY1]|nr:magnesium chelatase [Arthrospira platensis SPKY1]
QDRRSLLEQLPALLNAEHLASLQNAVQGVQVADAAMNYLQDLLDATRNGVWFVQGLSPRAGLAVLRAAKARALLEGRRYVAPDDIASILPQTAAHRLVSV